MKKILSYLTLTLLTGCFTYGQSSEVLQVKESGKSAVGSDYNLELNIATDCWPEETSWDLVSDDGMVVHEGGPYYGQELSDITEQFWLESGTYTFSFYDAAGDGLFATQWGGLCNQNGSFQLVDADGNVLLEDTGGMNFDTLFVSFEFDASVGIEENTLLGELTIFPNPVTDVANLMIGMKSGGLVEMELISQTGQLVRRESYNTLARGNHRLTISAADLPVGIYTLRVFSGSEFLSRRLVKMR